MFGYLNIRRETLADEKQGLWQTFMCGLCVSTKKLVGNLPRMFVNNDVNTFNVLFHAIANEDVTIDRAHCVAHPFRKRPILRTTEITDKLAIANVILTYWNLYDDVVDGAGAKKKLALKAVAKGYRKAAKQWKELDEQIADSYRSLRITEKANDDSIDRVAHHFALLSTHFCTLTLGDKADIYAQNLCYNLGKWVYLIDALDDIADDIKKGNYNPFVSCYHANTAAEVATHYDEIKYVMYTALNRTAQCYNDLNLTKYRCVTDNLVYDSIRHTTETILAKLKNKLPKTDTANADKTE